MEIPIIEEIVNYQTSELIAGRNPTTIKLTERQKERLKAYCYSTVTVHIAPDGTERMSAGLRYDEGMILGMKFKR